MGSPAKSTFDIYGHLVSDDGGDGTERLEEVFQSGSKVVTKKLLVEDSRRTLVFGGRTTGRPLRSMAYADEVDVGYDLHHGEIRSLSGCTSMGDNAAVESSTSAQLEDEGRVVRVNWADGVSSRFHAVWLRDNGHDEKTRDAYSWQKLTLWNDMPADTRVESARINAAAELEIAFVPDGWRTQISTEWLREHRYDRVPESPSLFREHVVTWDAKSASNFNSVSFADACTDPEVLLNWLDDVYRFGVGRLHDVPLESESVLDVIGLFGYPRRTQAGKWFEIKAVDRPSNLAISSLGLQPHTDNPYRDPRPTLQLFACLENTTEGGASLVVDGFKAAEILKQENPQYFDLLSRYDAQFDFHGGGEHHLRSAAPIIETSVTGQLRSVRFNNRSADAFTQIPYHDMPNYYAACRRFAELISSPELTLQFTLKPGQLFITDNTRVLHGRTAFSRGTRWMQGAYADKDALRSKIRVLRRELQDKTGDL